MDLCSGDIHTIRRDSMQVWEQAVQHLVLKVFQLKHTDIQLQLSHETKYLPVMWDKLTCK